MPRPILRSDVLRLEDLKPGMILKGTVRNVIDFGAFVDIGVHQDGLVHISQMSGTRFVKHPLEVDIGVHQDGLVHISQMSGTRFVKHPLEVVSVGDIVDVKVLTVDPGRKRIGLTMKLEN